MKSTGCQFAGETIVTNKRRGKHEKFAETYDTSR